MWLDAPDQAAHLYVPIMVPDAVKGQGGGHLFNIHGIPQVLLVGEHEDGRARKILQKRRAKRVSVLLVAVKDLK